MTIEGVDVGSRLKPASIAPEHWTATGVSMAGVATVQNYGVTFHPIVCNFLIAAATLSSLRAALDAVKRGGNATVVPDSGDDLGAGIETTTELVFDNYSASFVGGDLWAVQVTFNYYS
jgi:hypothetical protein